MDLREVEWGGIDWIDLSEDMDRWRALVIAVMNFRLYKMRGITWLAEDDRIFCTSLMVRWFSTSLLG
jgi:hypothetical protein